MDKLQTNQAQEEQLKKLKEKPVNEKVRASIEEKLKTVNQPFNK